MKSIFDFPDVHTHSLSRRHAAVVSGNPSQVAGWLEEYPEAYFSVGIHPWISDSPDLAREMALLPEVAANPRVLAIGEAGLDRLRGAPLEVQLPIFRTHIDLSNALAKPLVIHCARALDPLLAERRAARPSAPWIFHGFRGKPQQARSLLGASTAASPVYISLGPRFNPDTLAAIPPQRLLHETD